MAKFMEMWTKYWEEENNDDNSNNYILYSNEHSDFSFRNVILQS